MGSVFAYWVGEMLYFNIPNGSLFVLYQKKNKQTEKEPHKQQSSQIGEQRSMSFRENGCSEVRCSVDLSWLVWEIVSVVVLRRWSINLQIWIPQAQFFEALRCSLLLMLLYEIAVCFCSVYVSYLLLRILLHLRKCLFVVCSLLLLNWFGASSA